MGNDSERTVRKNLVTSLTRRDLLMRGTAAGFGLAAALLPRRDNTIQASTPDDDVPGVLSGQFTAVEEKINHLDIKTVALEAVNDESGNTSAVYSLLDYGSLQRADYSSSGFKKFEFIEETTKVPIDVCNSIVGFANYDSQGNELVVVGGHNTSADFYTKYPTLAVSKDKGRSFEVFPLQDEKGEAGEGIIREMKRIPHNDKVLFLIGQERSINRQYGIFDIKTNKFSMVTGEFEELPQLDDLFVHSDDPSTLLGCGRIVRKNEYGDSYVAAINNFSLDVENAVIYSSITHHDNIPFLDDVQVVRDEKGRPKEIYALQSQVDDDINIARNIWKIDPETPEADPTGFDYGFLDKWLVEAMDKSTYMNQEYIRRGISVRLSQIQTLPHGTWVTGSCHAFNSDRPFAAYWQYDKDSLPDETTLRIYPFDKVRIFPTEIEQELDFVAFHGSNTLRNGTTEHNYGLLLDLQVGGATIIQTDENYFPLDADVLYEKDSPHLS